MNIVLAVILIGISSAALAQEPPAADEQPSDPAADTVPLLPEPAPAPEEEGEVLDAIVVTAQKRAQYLTDVPMSVTAIKGEELEKMGARSLTDYAQTMPVLNYSSAGEEQSRINIRGMSGVCRSRVRSCIIALRRKQA
jgi:iron complex outermembrane receptor protein